MIFSPLLRNVAGYIDGKWITGGTGRIAVNNPANGEHLADVPDLGSAGTTLAIEAAERALLSPVPATERERWLRAIHQMLLEHKHEIARIITLEQGKPLKESVVEVEYAAGFFSYYASQLGHLAPDKLPQPIRNCHWTIHRRPAGVVGLITPWNFPLAMLAKKFAPSLASGCCAVVKPADLTPLTAIALWHILEKLDFPPGVCNLVIGQPEPIGEMLCSNPAVRLISFTGSTAVGRRLIAQTAPYVKRLSLELGGNAPFIVMADADIESAVAALMLNKFRCAGQTCVCANRILVAREIEEQFTEAIAARVQALKVGDGLAPETDIGPLINGTAVDKVNRHVDDAINKGARIITEPAVSPEFLERGHFRAPVVLGGLPHSAMMLAEETFGPVVGITSFNSEGEAIQLANSTAYGLASYLFSRDPERIARMVPRLHFGHIGVNTGNGPTPEAPFGGMKQSGFGREGGIDGLLEFCEAQTVAEA